MFTRSQKSPCAVVVTGAAGFLGQHVVKLLQTHADHVTEIRVLDVVPYVNKLDHVERVPVRQYVGSVTDATLIDEVCRGAASAMHVASFVDTSLLPDTQRSYDINVKGTENVVTACLKHGVKRLIYCSSTEVVCGKNDVIIDGTEENTSPRPHGHFFETYGHTKYLAEKMVLQANCATLRTVSLRPVVMYGELEWRSWEPVMNNYITAKTGNYFRLRCGKGRMEWGYVGNIAWGFVCADKTLLQNNEKADSASGQSYFISDDSPKKAMFDFMVPFLRDCGLKPFPVDVPLSLIVYPLYILYLILTLVSLFFKVNFVHGVPSFLRITKVFLFRYDKAARLLGYKPLYSYAEAKERTVKLLNNLKTRGTYSKC